MPFHLTRILAPSSYVIRKNLSIVTHTHTHTHTYLFTCLHSTTFRAFPYYSCPVLYKVHLKVMSKVDLVWRKATGKLETPEPKEREFPVDLGVNESVTINILIIFCVLERTGSD